MSNPNALALVNNDSVLEQVVINGDLSRLSPSDRVVYYSRVCESLGLNPLTKPFDYITLNGKLTLYCRKDATEQLRKSNGVSIQIVARECVEGCFMVHARATDQKGRTDEAIGAVAIDTLKGEARSNAMMKAETKAKRRVTLSIVGLGWTDESEVDSIPGAVTMTVDHATGEVIEPTRPVNQSPKGNHETARQAYDFIVEIYGERGASKAQEWCKTHKKPFTCVSAAMREAENNGLYPALEDLLKGLEVNE